MAYQDTWAICTKCGNQFVFRIEEQRQQAERGVEVTPPELCPSCRASARPTHHREPRREPTSRPRTEQPRKTSAVPEPGPHEGSVKWYDSEKGYGFIVQQSGDEIFFHRTGIAPGETPRFPDGTRVTFLIEETSKGLQAVDVARMDAENRE
jgi:CspA family cold shock protein